MTLYSVANPYPVILSQTGTGLNGGKVYIGVAGQDPETNPVAVYWDAAGTTPAAQPLTTIGGYIWNAGSPAQVYGPSEYSIRIRDRNNQQVFYEASVNGPLSDFIDALAAPEGAGLVGFSADYEYPRYTLGQKAREIVTLEDYGAEGDGETDDWNAIQNAINSGAKYVMGDSRKSYYCNGDLVFPPEVKLINRFHFGGYPNHLNPTDYSLLGSQIVLPSDRTIEISSPSCGLIGWVIRNAAITRGATRGSASYEAECDDILAEFGGTAVIASTDNATIHDLLVLGFNQAIDGTGAHRANIQRIGFDCTSGIKMASIYDVARIRDCHGWAFLTVGNDPTASSAVKMTRAGVGFEFLGVTDGNTIDHCFSYGHAQGFAFNGATDVTATACWADMPPGAADTSGIGFHVLGGATNTNLTSCKASSMARGLVANTDDVITATGWSSWVIRSKHVEHLDGTLKLISPDMDRQDGPIASKGIVIGGSIDKAVVVAPDFRNLDCWDIDAASVSKVAILEPSYAGTCSNTAGSRLTQPIRGRSYTVADLPTGSFGDRACVSDANSTTFWTVAAGGGSAQVPVFHDGVNWRIG